MGRRYRVVRTALGWAGFVAGPRGLQRLWLPMPSRSGIIRAIRRAFSDAAPDARLLPRLTRQLREYFAGRRVNFDVALDVGSCGVFTAAVWRACRRIPYGRTVTYQELAARAGRPTAARAVGGAMRRNPFLIVVPCHRVVRSDGTLGGYAGPGGISLKRRLLAMEQRTAGRTG